MNKKVSLNKTKHVETEKKLTNKVTQISEKRHDFLLSRMYFKGNNVYYTFLVFVPMLSSLILDSNKNVINWISAGISCEKFNPFDTNLERTIFDLADGRVILKI